MKKRLVFIFMTVDKMVVTNYFVTEELCHMINSDLLCEIY